jgi:hypothetical protein
MGYAFDAMKEANQEIRMNSKPDRKEWKETPAVESTALPQGPHATMFLNYYFNK